MASANGFPNTPSLEIMTEEGTVTVVNTNSDKSVNSPVIPDKYYFAGCSDDDVLSDIGTEYIIPLYSVGLTPEKIKQDRIRRDLQHKLIPSSLNKLHADIGKKGSTEIKQAETLSELEHYKNVEAGTFLEGAKNYITNNIDKVCGIIEIIHVGESTTTAAETIILQGGI